MAAVQGSIHVRVALWGRRNAVHLDSDDISLEYHPFANEMLNRTKTIPKKNADD